MPKRRQVIRMSEAEVWRFVESRKSLQLATNGADGWPHLVTVWFAVVDGRIVIETYRKSQKAVNLRRDPRCSLLWEAGETYETLAGVSMKGRAALHDDEETVHALTMHVARRNRPGVPEAELAEANRARAPKKTAVVVTPGKIMSWDHGKLGGVY